MKKNVKKLEKNLVDIGELMFVGISEQYREQKSRDLLREKITAVNVGKNVTSGAGNSV